MALSRTALENARTVGVGIMAGLLFASAVIAAQSCSATPAQKARAAQSEIDLCRLRQVAAGLEAINPDLRPPEGSVRAQIEAAEDALCARVLTDDAGQSGAENSQ